MNPTDFQASFPCPGCFDRPGEPGHEHACGLCNNQKVVHSPRCACGSTDLSMISEKPEDATILCMACRSSWALGTVPSGALHPSHDTKNFWHVTSDLTRTQKHATARSGKWLVFVPPEELDARWGLIRKATEEGRLGYSSKVSTSRPSPNASGPERVICVHTYDSDDEADVQRVRDVLRELGFTAKIPYKTDAMTQKGHYAEAGKRVSKYFT